MRKITSVIKNAWLKSESKSMGNTQTDGKNVWLHGNKIIETRGKNVYVTLAGWHTRTTIERCNYIADAKYTTKNFEPYHDGIPVSSEEWICVGTKESICKGEKQ